MPMPKLSNVSSKFGAPMGRPSSKTENDDQRFYLQRLDFVDGDYDEGGAYWGSGTPVWRCVSQDLEGENFFRAANREAAKAEVRKLYPKARFFR